MPVRPSLATPPTDRFALLLGLLVAALVITGLDSSYAVWATAILNAVVMIVAFTSAGLARSGARAVVLVAIALIGVATSSILDLERSVGAIGWTVQAAILASIILVVARRVLEHERVGLQTIAGALCLYVLIGLVFGSVYGALEAVTDDAILQSDAEGRADPIYYSFVTLTTVGFGDVTSSVELVRRVTIIQAMIGQFFLATMVARLVSMFGALRHGAGAE